MITQQYVLSFQSQQIEDTRANAFPAGCPDIGFSAPFCSSFATTTVFLLTHFGALAEFKVLPQKAKKQTIRELSRKTPNSIGAKLFIASTASRAYRNINLGALTRCCEAFDRISFECVDFQRLSKIIANLTRENLAEREAEITNLPWTQTKKDNALARCRSGQRAWRNKKTRALFQCCH